jgi:hypothetical protein
MATFPKKIKAEHIEVSILRQFGRLVYKTRHIPSPSHEGFGFIEISILCHMKPFPFSSLLIETYRKKSDCQARLKSPDFCSHANAYNLQRKLTGTKPEDILFLVEI